jgi:hypothetical protein
VKLGAEVGKSLQIVILEGNLCKEGQKSGNMVRLEGNRVKWGQKGKIRRKYVQIGAKTGI